MLKIALISHGSRDANPGVGALRRANESIKPRLFEAFAQWAELRDEISQALVLGRDKLHSYEGALVALMQQRVAEQERR